MRPMYYRRSLIKGSLIVLVTLLVLAGSLVSLPYHPIAADDLLLQETSPLPPSPEEDYIPDEIIVRFRPGIDVVSARQLNNSLGTDVVYASPYAGFKVLRIPEGKTVAEMVALYSKQSIVEYAEPNYISHITWSPDDTSYSYQWHFYQINLEDAWDLDTTSPNYGGDPSIIVAVIDSGVAYETYDTYVQAPDLANTNFWTNTDETAGNSTDDDGNGYVDDINGWDFVNSDAHPNDDNSHGTHVCGTIAQSTNNSLGVAGIAFNSTIMPLKAFNSAGSGTDAWIADAFYYAADNGAKIINYSAGGPSSTTLQNAVAYTRNAGVIIIAATGNKGDTTNDVEYPAAYNDYVIAVGATSYNQTRSYYSSYGSHCDVAAPGGDTTADENGDGYVDGVLQNTFHPITRDVTDFSYWFLQGTSMATPHVSGVAALILAKNPTWNPEQVRHALQSTANDLGTAGKDDEYGWGLIDAYAAVNTSLPVTASFSDEAHTTPDDDFAGNENTVYMSVNGLLLGPSYEITYYDGSNAKRITDSDPQYDPSGNLTSQHTFSPEADIAGTWHVIVSEQNFIPPNSYNATWSYTITSDNFTVQQSAIPEFPTVVAAIIALGLCLGAYLWLRRKAIKVST